MKTQVFRARRVFVRTVAVCLVAMVAVLATGFGDGSASPAAVITGGGWATSADAPSTVTRGGTAAIRINVVSASTTSALIDAEIYDGAGVKVGQTYWDGRAFRAGTARVFTLSWSVPAAQAAGTYSVKVGVFNPRWAGLLLWNDDAAHFQVTTGSAPTTTTTVRPTTTTTTVRPTTTTTTVKPTTTTTTVRPTTTTTTVRPTTTTAPSGHFSTLGTGAALPTDAQCAAAVRPAAEIRADNAALVGPGAPAPYNATRGSTPQSGFYARVTGNFTGTTDEIIQWAACKWGIDEDIVRAQAAKESWWHQNAGGDLTTDRSLCAPGAPTNGTTCAESVGIMQVRYAYWGAGFPSALNSTAYNLDYALAARRNCFEGNDSWLGGSYAKGDLWGCVGLWFSGRWHDAAAESYISAVQDLYNSRVWTSSSFING